MYNLLLADDEGIVRRGIKTLVDYASLGIGEVFEAENGEEALDDCQTRKRAHRVRGYQHAAHERPGFCQKSPRDRQRHQDCADHRV